MTYDLPKPDNVVETVELFRLRFANGEGRPNEFSRRGLSTLVAWQDDYLKTLGMEAIRLAVVDRADSVSASHIDEANRKLRYQARVNPLRWIAVLALGAGIPLVVQYFAMDNPPKSLVAWLAVSLGTASATLAAALAFEIRKSQR